MGACTGLDYGPLFQLLDRAFGQNHEAWQTMFYDVQTLESAALEQIRNNHPSPP